MSSLRKTHLIPIASALAALTLLATEVGPDAPDASPAASEAAAQADAPAVRSSTAAWPAPDATVAGAAISPWRTDQVTVTLKDVEALDAVAASVGAEIVRRPLSSRTAAITVPDGWDRAALIATLNGHPDVQRAGRQGVTHGAGESLSNPWHLQSGDFDEADWTDVSGITIAVLDTGAAYEDYSDDAGVYVATPCLAAADIRSPRDVVNDDLHANDDHQHGTHISSSIVADCELTGSAPGARLMPIKVLDHTNSGVESDLVEGIWWAIDNGADVINLSLTFRPGYVPSPELLEAIEAAAQADIVLVGASGNDGLDQVGWPAASPQVIAVAAGCPVPDHSENLTPAPYSNRGLEVDVIAGGGCLDVDLTDNGIPDGVVAEAFPVGSPEQPGLWLAAGTSQAAAMVSGAAARLLAAGAEPEHVRLYLQDESEDNVFGGNPPFLDLMGAGVIDVEDAVQEAELEPNKFSSRRYFGAVLPLLRDNGDGTVTPGARFTVLEHDLDPADNVYAAGEVVGEGGRIIACLVQDDVGDESGQCFAWGNPVPAESAQGWKISLSSVVRGDESYRPTPVLFASADLEQLAADLAAHDELNDASLGVYWPDGATADGAPLAESWVIMNTGTGISTSPFGVVLPPIVIDPEVEIMDGNGISTSPFGLKVLEFQAGDLGLEGLEVVAIDGTGISTSPFGMIPDLPGLPGTPMCMPAEDDDCEDDGFGGDALDAQRLAGGWVSPTYGPAATAVMGSGLLGEPAQPMDGGATLGMAPYTE